MLELIECVPDYAKMPVAELNVENSAKLLWKGYARGLGHYLLHGRLVQKHIEAGQGRTVTRIHGIACHENSTGESTGFFKCAGGLSKSEKQCSLKMDKFSFLTFSNSGRFKFSQVSLELI